MWKRKKKLRLPAGIKCNKHTLIVFLWSFFSCEERVGSSASEATLEAADTRPVEVELHLSHLRRFQSLKWKTIASFAHWLFYSGSRCTRVSGVSSFKGQHVEALVLRGVEHVGNPVADGGARPTHTARRQGDLHDPHLHPQRLRVAAHDPHSPHGAVLSLRQKRNSITKRKHLLWVLFLYFVENCVIVRKDNFNLRGKRKNRRPRKRMQAGCPNSLQPKPSAGSRVCLVDCLDIQAKFLHCK